MEIMHIRSIPGSELVVPDAVHDVDSRSHEVVIHVPHAVTDSYQTQFAGPDNRGNRGAFAESFARRLPAFCWQHNLKEPLGSVQRAQVLPAVNEIVCRFSDIDAVPIAKRAFTQVQDGSVRDASFGYIDGREIVGSPGTELEFAL